MKAAVEKYRDTLRDCLFARDARGVTEKAAEAAAAARIPLAVAEIPAGASCPPSPMLVIALADTEAEARVAAVAEVVAPIVVAFCRAHEGKGVLP